jgi:hypothetical protein
MLADSELHANVPASDLKRHCAESPDQGGAWFSTSNAHDG